MGQINAQMKHGVRCYWLQVNASDLYGVTLDEYEGEASTPDEVDGLCSSL